MNKLNGTRCYLIGPMEFQNGQKWREETTKKLREYGVKVFDPYNKPFTNIDYREDEEVHASLNRLRSEGDLKELNSIMRKIRASDLRLCDISDFFIAYYNKNVHTCGSIEELTTINRAKKPVFIVVEGGKRNAPFWLYGMFALENFYSSFSEVYDKLDRYNSGEKEFDNTRWHLLKEEYV